MNDGPRLGNPDWAGQTSVHPIGLAAVIVLGLCILFLPRRWAVLPMMIIACFIPSGQRIVIASCDFSFLRIMVLFGFARLLLTKENAGFSWTKLDTAVVLWTLSSMVMYSVRLASMSAVINRLGFGFDAFGMYFLFRCLIRDWGDVEALIIGTIVVSIPVAVFFLVENRTGRNIFAVFGGVPPITTVRDGKLRCQGAFSHPILAGSFWASLVPLFAALWWKTKSRFSKPLAITGISTVLLIVFACASSTPVFALISAMIGALMFYFRRQMRTVRWGLLLTLVGLHVIMNNPVWHLFARVSAVGGGTGWHRFNVIDSTVRYFREWWLMGTSNIGHWGVWAGDMTNHYVVQGLTGGLLTMLLFIYILVVAFSYVGTIWRYYRKNQYLLALSWATGVSLFVHCMNFFGSFYFGQIIISLYLTLAVIGSLYSTIPIATSANVPAGNAYKTNKLLLKT